MRSPHTRGVDLAEFLFCSGRVTGFGEAWKLGGFPGDLAYAKFPMGGSIRLRRSSPLLQKITHLGRTIEMRE